MHGDNESDAARVASLVDDMEDAARGWQRAWEELEMMLDCRERVRTELDELVEWCVPVFLFIQSCLIFIYVVCSVDKLVEW